MDPKKPIITICIPTFNRAIYLREAIKSALSQWQKNIEIVAIDDGSTDNTKNILKEFESEKLRYLCKNHTGAPDTRNQAIQQAKGKYLLWLDSDDILMPGAVAKYIQAISDFPEVDVHYGDLVIVDSNGDFKHDQRYPDYYEQNDVLLSRLLIGNSIPNGGTLIRKSVYKKYGIYNKKYKRAHDYEFWVRVARHIKFKHIGTTVYKWRWHDSNMSSGSVQFDTSYEIQIKKELLKAYSLKELFPQLNWKKEKQCIETACLAIGNLFIQLGGYQEAIEYFEKCVKINKRTDYYYALVLSYFQLENLEKALWVVNELLTISPEHNQAKEMSENLMKIIAAKKNKHQINVEAIANGKNNQRRHVEENGSKISVNDPMINRSEFEAIKTSDEKLPITAIIAAFNEGDVIYHVIRDLVEQDIQVVFIDHHSSDNTLEEVRRWEGKGVVRIESFPEDAGLDIPSNVYSWRHILRRKQQIASEMGPGWYLHADADEFRESPWRDLNLREGIERVDREGFNAINFKIYDFKPTHNRFEPGQDVRKHLTHYDPDIHAFNHVQIKCWKNFGQEINLWKSGGHSVAFKDRKVYPVPFILRHYAIRSQHHGIQKVFQDRKTRFDRYEREAQWHDQYVQVKDKRHNFIREETELIPYDRQKACWEVQSTSSSSDHGYYEFSRPEVQAMVASDARVVLDVGCASGRMGGEIKFKLKAEVWGIEPVAEVARRAGKILDRVIVAPVEQAIPELPDGYFDCIIFADVLEHLQNPDQVLLDIKSKLKSTGEIIASMPNVRHWSVVKDLLEGRWEYVDAGILDRTHLRFFTRKSAQDLLKKTGYHIHDMQTTLCGSQEIPAELVKGMAKSGLKIGSFVEEANHYQYLIKGGLTPLAALTQKSNPLVSIIILTFNELNFTKKCVDSIRKHTRYPYEIIFVDNASTDGTRTYLNRLTKSNDHYQVIHNEENLGFAAGNNQGIAVATGKYILLMNNDIVVTPGWLDRLVSCAERDTRIGIVGPMSNSVSGPQLIKDVPYNLTDLGGLDDFAAEFSKRNAGKVRRFMRVVGFCMLIKRAVVDKIGGLDSRYGIGNFEDDDFSLRAALAGFESWMAADCFIHHFGNRTFIGARIDYNESLTKNWEIFKHKWNLPLKLQLGAKYNWAQILKKGFVREEHYCPIAHGDSMEAGQKAVSAPVADVDPLREIYQKVERLVKDGRQTEAVSELEKLVEMHPDFAAAHNDLGILYYNQGDKEKALRHYEHAVRIDPHNLTFKKNLADYYFVAAGRVEEALAIYNKVLEVDFGDVDALMSMGLICEALERPEDARHFYNRVLEVEPGNVNARRQMENLYPN